MTGPAKAYLLVLLLRLVACEDDSGTEIVVPTSVSKRPDFENVDQNIVVAQKLCKDLLPWSVQGAGPHA